MAYEIYVPVLIINFMSAIEYDFSYYTYPIPKSWSYGDISFYHNLAGGLKK